MKIGFSSTRSGLRKTRELSQQKLPIAFNRLPTITSMMPDMRLLIDSTRSLFCLVLSQLFHLEHARTQRTLSRDIFEYSGSHFVQCPRNFLLDYHEEFTTTSPRTTNARSVSVRQERGAPLCSSLRAESST